MNMTTATNTNAAASVLLLTHTPKAELSNPVKSTRTRTTKREIGIGYNVDKVKAALGPDVKLDSWDVVLKPENLDKLNPTKTAKEKKNPVVMPVAAAAPAAAPSSEDKLDILVED